MPPNRGNFVKFSPCSFPNSYILILFQPQEKRLNEEILFVIKIWSATQLLPVRPPFNFFEKKSSSTSYVVELASLGHLSKFLWGNLSFRQSRPSYWVNLSLGTSRPSYESGFISLLVSHSKFRCVPTFLLSQDSLAFLWVKLSPGVLDLPMKSGFISLLVSQSKFQAFSAFLRNQVSSAFLWVNLSPGGLNLLTESGFISLLVSQPKSRLSQSFYWVRSH